MKHGGASRAILAAALGTFNMSGFELNSIESAKHHRRKGSKRRKQIRSLTRSKYMPHCGVKETARNRVKYPNGYTTKGAML